MGLGCLGFKALGVWGLGNKAWSLASSVEVWGFGNRVYGLGLCT